MNIGFIGAGKVGTAFGKYLSNNGFNVEGYYSKREKSAQHAARYCDSRAYVNMKDLTQKVDIIFITTNDDEIEKVADLVSSRMVTLRTKLWPMSCVVLTSQIKSCAFSNYQKS